MRHRDQRFPCDTELTVVHDGTACRARLVNVSVTGGRLEGAGRVPRGATLWLHYLNARIAARVVWSTERQAAIQFAEPLTPASFSALRREGGRAPTGGGWTPPGHQGFRELT